MLDANKCIFDAVAPNGDFRTIAEVHFPMDGQMNDNLALYCAFTMYSDFIVIFIRVLYVLALTKSND